MKRFQFISRLATSVAAVALTLGTAVTFSSCSDDDDDVNTTPTIVKLDAPGNPTASVSGADLSASWTAVSGAESYTAQIRFTKYGDIVRETLTPQTSVTFSDLENSDYVFRVRANDANTEAKNSDWSEWIENLTVAVDPEFMPLDTPKDPVWVEGETTSASLTFTWEVVENAENYTYKLSDSVGETVKEDIVAELTVTVANLKAGETYTFMVKANPAADTDCYRSSSYSKSVTGTTMGQLATPQSLEVSLRMAEALTFRWSEVENAGSYVYEFFGPSQEEPILTGSTAEAAQAGDIVAETTNTSVSFSGLDKDSYYSLRVKAVPAEGANFAESPYTDYCITKTLVTDATPLTSPVLSVVATPVGFTVSWSPVTGAKSYKVQFGTSIGEAEVAEPTVIEPDELGVLATEFAKTGLTAATAYYVRVMACADPEDTSKVDSEYSAWADASTAALQNEMTIDNTWKLSDALLWMAEGGTLYLKGGDYAPFESAVYFSRGVRIVAVEGESPVLYVNSKAFNITENSEIGTIEFNGIELVGIGDEGTKDHIFNTDKAFTADWVKFINCKASKFKRSFLRTQSTGVIKNVLIENTTIEYYLTDTYDVVQLNSASESITFRNSTFVNMISLCRNNGATAGVLTVENCSFVDVVAKSYFYRGSDAEATFKNCVISGALANYGYNDTAAGLFTAENYYVASDVSAGKPFAVAPIVESLTSEELFPNAAAGNYAPAASSKAYEAKAGDPRWY